MKSTVETLSPTRVRLAVEVPFEELKPSMDRAYKSIAQQMRVPGFRPGKVPAAIIDQRVGRDAVLQEAVQDALPRAYAEAVRSNDVRTLGQPEIELTRVDQAEGIAFTAEVDVRPPVNLPDVGSISVTVDDVEVTAEEVDQRIDVLRERFGMLKTAERPVQTGDYVTIDLVATVDGEEVESRAGLSYEVGSENLIDGLDAALEGLSSGEEATFQTELVAGEFADRTADVNVTVRSVKEKELPELDDEFAQTASEFDTLDELRTDIEAKVARVKTAEQGIQARDRVLDALLERAEVPLPVSVVENEYQWRQNAFAEQVQSVGLELDQYLERQGQSREEFDAELRTAAETAVKTQLVLDALADAEQVGVSEQELTEHVVVQAQRYGVPPQEFAQRMSDAGNLPTLVAEVRRNKALLTALDAAEVTDASGNRVDVGALRRGGAEETPADNTAEDTAEDTAGETETTQS